MGRIITTETNLSNYIDKYVKIAGSDCCWQVLGTGPKDITNRPVTVLDSKPNCDYILGMGQVIGEILDEMDIEFLAHFP